MYSHMTEIITVVALIPMYIGLCFIVGAVVLTPVVAFIFGLAEAIKRWGSPPVVKPEPLANRCAGRALVIDDDSEFSEVIARILRSKNFTVDCASNLRDAGALVSRQRYDCVFCDYFLEGTLGTEVCDRLFSDEQKKKCVIISAGDRELVYRKPESYSGFIHKPCTAQDILSQAEKICH